MNSADQGLLRHIVVVVVIKLVLITALWWAFIRDSKVAVDPAAMAAQLSTPAASRQSPPAGETHDQ